MLKMTKASTEVFLLVLDVQNIQCSLNTHRKQVYI